MALRVLLADESATIKKVFQLALQDYGVEVMTVSVGLDVVDVAAKFKPDLVFADVLLPRKSGYQVCTEIKSHPELKNVPVVLVWSGFMELDQEKFKACAANGQLEKPFETFQLRELVQSLVPKTQKQTLGQFLSFPKLPDFEEKEKPAPKPTFTPPPPPPEIGGFELSTAAPIPRTPIVEEPAIEHLQPLETKSSEKSEASWSMENFSELPPIPEPEMPDLPNNDEGTDEFMSVQLPTQPPKKPANLKTAPPPLPTEEETSPEADEQMWVQKTLTNFKIDKKRQQDEAPSVSYKIPQEKIDPDSIVTNTMTMRPNTAVTKTNSKPTARKPEPETDTELELDLGEVTRPPTQPQAPQLTERQLEAVIRSQSKEMIEKVVWQVVPEIATRIIEREIERLMKERFGQ